MGNLIIDQNGNYLSGVEYGVQVLGRAGDPSPLWSIAFWGGATGLNERQGRRIAIRQNAVVANLAYDNLPGGRAGALVVLDEQYVQRGDARLGSGAAVAVYISLDGLYVGITNNLGRHAGEHHRRGRIIRPLIAEFVGLIRAKARAVEQALIVRYGLMRDGGILHNKRNEISPTRPDYMQTLMEGRRILDMFGL